MARFFKILIISALFVCLCAACGEAEPVVENAPDYSVRAEFNLAVVSGDFAKVKTMAENTPELLNAPLAVNEAEYAKGKRDETPLVAAAGNREMLRLLIDLGADVNGATPFSGHYPLTVALAEGSRETRLETAWYLIERGADVSVEDKTYGSYLCALLRVPSSKAFNEQNIAELLVRYAWENGIDFEVSGSGNGEYTSLLGLAVKNGYSMAVDFMIYHACVDVTEPVTASGKTALELAEECGLNLIASILISAGASD